MSKHNDGGVNAKAKEPYALVKLIFQENCVALRHKHS